MTIFGVDGVNLENKYDATKITKSPEIMKGFCPNLSESLPLTLAVKDIPSAPGKIKNPASSGVLPLIS